MEQGALTHPVHKGGFLFDLHNAFDSGEIQTFWEKNSVSDLLSDLNFQGLNLRPYFGKGYMT